jgi:hypothetical protein
VKNIIALWSIWAALDGDPKRLAKRLRAGLASREEMAFAADLLEGKVKVYRRRPRQPTRRTNDEIGQAVLFMSEIYPNRSKTKSIIPDVAKAFGVSEKHVFNSLADMTAERRASIVKSAPAVAAVVRGGAEFKKLERSHKLARK